jgi:hypothetical protein
MASKTLSASPGDDLFRLAAEQYGDADGWTLIARANSLYDPIIQTDILLVIPEYSEARANDGIWAPA